MEESGKITESTDVSLEAKAKIIDTLECLITMQRLQKLDLEEGRWRKKKLIHLKYGVGGELYGYPGLPERRTPGSQSTLSLKRRWRQK